MTLAFSNPVFKKGKNLTVRRGIHWANRKTSNFDIINTQVIRFRELKDSHYKKALAFEHDPSCRNYEGLKKEMKKVYKGFSANELVTLVFFKELSKK